MLVLYKLQIIKIKNHEIDNTNNRLRTSIDNRIITKKRGYDTSDLAEVDWSTCFRPGRCICTMQRTDDDQSIRRILTHVGTRCARWFWIIWTNRTGVKNEFSWATMDSQRRASFRACDMTTRRRKVTNTKKRACAQRAQMAATQQHTTTLSTRTLRTGSPRRSATRGETTILKNEKIRITVSRSVATAQQKARLHMEL